MVEYLIEVSDQIGNKEDITGKTDRLDHLPAFLAVCFSMGYTEATIYSPQITSESKTG